MRLLTLDVNNDRGADSVSFGIGNAGTASERSYCWVDVNPGRAGARWNAAVRDASSRAA